MSRRLDGCAIVGTMLVTAFCGLAAPESTPEWQPGD